MISRFLKHRRGKKFPLSIPRKGTGQEFIHITLPGQTFADPPTITMIPVGAKTGEKRKPLRLPTHKLFSGVKISLPRRKSADVKQVNPKSARSKMSTFLVIVAAIVLIVGYILPSNSSTNIIPNNGSAAPIVLITADPNSITATPFGPDPNEIKDGTCGSNEFFMPMYDKRDPVTGDYGIGVVVFDSTPGQQICIPEWKLFKEMVTNNKSGDELLQDQSFVDYTGKLAFRMAAALGLPDTDLIARQGVRRAIAEAFRIALAIPQPADDPSGVNTHGYIFMPVQAMIEAATAQVRLEVASKPGSAAKLPNGNNGDVVKTVPTPREILEGDIRIKCTEKAVADIELCVKTIVDTYLVKPANEQTPDVLKGLLINYFTMLVPTTTPAPVVIPGDSSYSELERKANDACAVTKHPVACVSKMKQTYATSPDLYAALQAGIKAGNLVCPVYIPEIAFADIAGRQEIRNSVSTLNVWRLVNENQGATTTLAGVGFNNGQPAVCIDRITGAPTVVAGGIWENQSINYTGSASQYFAEYAGGGYMTGGIISFNDPYPADPGGGIYHMTIDLQGGYARNVFSIPVAGMFVAPVINVMQIRPTDVVVNIVDTPWKAQLYSSGADTPVPNVSVSLPELEAWMVTNELKQFYLQFECPGFYDIPPSIITGYLGSQQINLDVSVIKPRCYHQSLSGQHSYFAITTDRMQGLQGWIQYGKFWVTADP